MRGYPVYHGTSEKNLDRIMKNGLTPRYENPSRWENYPSRTDMVYLTSAYPFYFAVKAAQEDGSRALVVEVDLDLLDPDELYPDEDFIVQAGVRDPDFLAELKKQGIEEFDDIQFFVRDHLEVWQEAWEASLKGLGNCAYQGTVEPHTISRYCLFDYNARPELAVMTMDPQISLLNFQLLGNKYINLVEWMFDDAPELWDEFAGFEGGEDLPDVFRQRAQQLKQISTDRTGIEVVEVNY